MRDLDTGLLRTFLVLAQTRSFSRTAERVGRSQSAVSAQIQKLEALLGVTLFHRDRRNVHLSADGDRLLEPARQMLQLTDSVVERFRSHAVVGEVRFGSPEDFATHHLPDILAAFARAHPSVRLDVNCELTLHLIAGLEAGRYDLIVIKQDPAAEHPRARSMWRERLVWVGAVDHGDEGGQSAVGRTPADATPEAPIPLVLSPPPCVYRSRATGALDRAGVPWTVAYTSPSVAGAVAAVRAGLGFTVLPRTMVPAGLAIQETKAGWPELKDAQIGLLMNDSPSPAVQALATFVTERLSSYR